MSEIVARRIWLFCSAVFFVLAFNYLSISQNWGASFGLGFFSVELGAESFLDACLVGAPIIAIGLLVTSYIGSRYVNIVKVQHGSWDTRVPSKISGIQAGGQESKIIAFASLLFFKIVPVFILWHLLRKFYKYAEVCDKETQNIIGIFSRAGGFSGWNDRYLVGVKNAACDGSTFEPFVQPILMVLLAVSATISALMYIIKVMISTHSNVRT